MVNTEFWKGKRILVTGHTGFKGAWLIEWLLTLGAYPAGFALSPPSQPALFQQLGLAGRMEHHLGDVRDLKALATVARKVDPEIVIHMAAQSLVRESYNTPVETYSVNVLGTAHVLEVCRELERLRAVIIVTTDKCYENREWYWGYRENEPLGGHDPYSSSKACAELVTKGYRRSFFEGSTVHIASARAGNVIGGGDWATGRLIPDAIRAFTNHECLHVRYPESVRPWQFVLEPLHGYLCLAEALCGPDGAEFADAWNFGPVESDAKSVRWIVDELVTLWGDDASWTHDTEPELHEAAYLKLDCAKARVKLAWTPMLTIENTLRLTVDWYRACVVDQCIRTETQKQIETYMNSVQGVGSP